MTAQNNQHAQITREGLEYFKQLTHDLDGWEFRLEQNKVKIYNRKLTDENQPPLVRGDTIISNIPAGCTLSDFISITNITGCRKVWDDKQDKNEVKEFYSRNETLFYLKQKAPWPISPRDFVGTCILEHTPEATYSSVISVQDSRVPEVSKTVRGKILISGWKYYWADENKTSIGIIHVNQVDLAGSLPSSFLKNLYLQVPLYAGKIRDYMSQYGFIPSLRWLDSGIQYKGQDFDHDTKKSDFNFAVPTDIQGKAAEIVCCSKMYPKGVKVEIKGGTGRVEQAMDEDKNYRVVINGLKGSTIVKIVVCKK